VGNGRKKDVFAGLKEHVTFYLDGPTADSCSHTFTESSSNRVISETTNEKTIELPLDPGLVKLRVEYEGSGCPCESAEIELEVVEPTGITYSINTEKFVIPREIYNEAGIQIGWDSSRVKRVTPPVWHIKDKVSAGILYKMVLQPVGVSFARLHVWEGAVVPIKKEGPYFDSISTRQVAHRGTPREPWDSTAYQGGTRSALLGKNIDIEGIPSADRVFSAFECKDVIDPLLSGSLTWDIPTFREDRFAGGAKRIATISQEFIHEVEDKKLSKAKSFVGKSGIYSSKVKVRASTNTDKYYTSSSQTRIPSCN